MPGHLNAFQRVMLQWNDLQPYNAVHVVRLTRPLDPDRLRLVIQASLIARGVACLTLNPRRATFNYQSGSAPIEIRILSPGAGLDAQLEWELNSPFQIHVPFCPVRFFVLPEGDGFALGAGYFHPMADAESMILLLRGIVADYLESNERGSTRPFVCHVEPGTGGRRGAGIALRMLLGLPAELRVMRRSYRLAFRDRNDQSNRICQLTAGSRALGGLVSSARHWNVTVHDVLLALLMQALAAVTPYRKRHPHRQEIALGSVVNVRGDGELDRQLTFGLFLGSFVVRHRVPPGIDLRRLATDLNCQTRRIKRLKLYLCNLPKLALVRRLFTLYSAERRKQFYRKYYPLAGGISNMNLEGYWPEPGHATPADHFRAVSTGPVTPLVLSASTYGGHMTLVLTYRPGVFSPAHVAQIANCLESDLGSLEDPEC
jgi:hypothetical protein